MPDKVSFSSFWNELQIIQASSLEFRKPALKTWPNRKTSLFASSWTSDIAMNWFQCGSNTRWSESASNRGIVSTIWSSFLLISLNACPLFRSRRKLRCNVLEPIYRFNNNIKRNINPNEIVDCPFVEVLTSLKAWFIMTNGISWSCICGGWVFGSLNNCWSELHEFVHLVLDLKDVWISLLKCKTLSFKVWLRDIRIRKEVINVNLNKTVECWKSYWSWKINWNNNIVNCELAEIVFGCCILCLCWHNISSIKHAALSLEKLAVFYERWIKYAILLWCNVNVDDLMLGDFWCSLEPVFANKVEIINRLEKSSIFEDGSRMHHSSQNYDPAQILFSK